MDFGKLAVRGVVGPLFIGHGTQKLFGWFGGHGLEGTGGFFESLGLQPGRRKAQAAGLAETVGGVMVTLGALTPLAAMALNSTMVTAIRKVHADKGPWVSEGGFEYNAVLIAVLTALADLGPGRPSVDARLFPRLHGPGYAVAQLAGAVVGSYLAAPDTTDRQADQGAEPSAAEAAAGGPSRFQRDQAPASSTPTPNA
jgi:putative oxidoreductase